MQNSDRRLEGAGDSVGARHTQGSSTILDIFPFLSSGGEKATRIQFVLLKLPIHIGHILSMYHQFKI